MDGPGASANPLLEPAAQPPRDGRRNRTLLQRLANHERLVDELEVRVARLAKLLETVDVRPLIASATSRIARSKTCPAKRSTLCEKEVGRVEEGRPNESSEEDDTAHIDSSDELGHSKPRPWLLGIFVAALFLLGIWQHDAVARFLHWFLDWCKELGLWSAVLLGLLTAALQMLMLPTFPIMIGAGVLFAHMYGTMWGSVVGTLSVFGGLWLGSVLAFAVGRFFLKDMADKMLKNHKALQVVNGMITEEGVRIVFLARMSPLLPAEVFNYACSLVQSLTVPMYALGCTGSIVPVGFWVSSSAQATAVASSTDASSQPGGSGSVVLVFINLAVILALSYVFYSAYERYRIRTSEKVLTKIISRERTYIVVEPDGNSEEDGGPFCGRIGVPYDKGGIPTGSYAEWGSTVKATPVGETFVRTSDGTLPTNLDGTLVLRLDKSPLSFIQGFSADDDVSQLARSARSDSALGFSFCTPPPSPSRDRNRRVSATF